MIGITVSHYKILKKLGEGGMGVVFKALDTKLNRAVALKFLPPHLVASENEKKRFIHEAQAASALDHPNICTIYEIGETDGGKQYIAMSYYDGETLQQRLHPGETDDAAPMEIDDIVSYSLQLADGLHTAHKKGIIHRDIKGSNVILTTDGLVKIMDFGLAKVADQTMMTKTGATVGTVLYMSPEQARGEKVNHQTDIWSLGVMMYEMVTGTLPFKSTFTDAVIYSILNEDPQPPSALREDIPEGLERIIMKCLEKDQSNRYRSMVEIIFDLRSMQRTVRGEREPLFIFHPSKRKPLLYGGAAILVVSILIVLIFFTGITSLLLKPAPGITSLAVMPFENLSGDPDQEYFSDGITDALIADLAKLSGLKRVIARASVMRYKSTEIPLTDVAQELGVNALVTGSVLRAENRMRVTAQLLDGSTGEMLWADRYERDLRDALSLQNEIVASIAQGIRIRLNPEDETRLASVRRMETEAYEDYLRGMSLLQQYDPAGTRQGLTYLHSAVAKDPAHPLPYAGLAQGYAFIGHAIAPPHESFPRAAAAALQALALDSTLAVAYAALAEVKLYYQWDWEGAEEAFQRAIELNPSLSFAHGHYSWYLILHDRIEESLEAKRRAMESDPLDPFWIAGLGWLYAMIGEYDEAIHYGRKSLELRPTYGLGYHVIGMGFTGKGMYLEAIDAHERAAELFPVFLKWGLGHIYAKAGRREEALRIVKELEVNPIAKDLWGIPQIYTALGDKDEAFRWLEAAYEYRIDWLPFMKREFAFIPLRDDPRFEDLLQRMNLSMES